MVAYIAANESELQYHAIAFAVLNLISTRLLHWDDGELFFLNHTI
jgi:hypothetical protein